MSWYALVAAREAVGATRALLVGRSIPDWARLAVLTVFVGGPTTTLVADFNRSDPLAAELAAVDLADPGVVPAALLALLVGTLALSVFLLAGAVFEFVVLETLRGRPIGVLTPVAGNVRPGLDLFAFRLGVYGVVVATLVLALAILGVERTDGRPVALASFSVATVGVFGLVLSRTTSRLVAPIMLVEGCSLREGWRRLLARVETHPGEYAVYLAVDLATFTLVIVFGTALGGLAALAVALPLGAFGLGVGSVLVASGLSTAVVTTVTGLLLVPPYLVGALALVALVHVPATVYVRYLALLTLSKTDRRYAHGGDGPLDG